LLKTKCFQKIYQLNKLHFYYGRYFVFNAIIYIYKISPFGVCVFQNTLFVFLKVFRICFSTLHFQATKQKTKNRKEKQNKKRESQQLGPARGSSRVAA
jgi:hypothetical protein